MDRDQITGLLNAGAEAAEEIYRRAASVRDQVCGNRVFLRGLIEYSNICSKNCLYCGIRAANHGVGRYIVNDDDVVEAAVFAKERKYGSIVIQSGERSDKAFIHKTGSLLGKIHRATGHTLRITLSCGEQTSGTYRYWKECGAHRYLLRIEASNPDLYRKIHPAGRKHDYGNRVKALESLIKLGYQTGTGVMIGLPFQTVDDLADDLIFFRDLGIHMVGMGPYIEHPATPLASFRHLVPDVSDRIRFSLNMIAALRLLMPDINIASTTALQTLGHNTRAKGIRAGANVVMPNLTPLCYKNSYLLYKGKTGVHDSPDQVSDDLEEMIRSTGCELVKDEWGDPLAIQKLSLVKSVRL